MNVELVRRKAVDNKLAGAPMAVVIDDTERYLVCEIKDAFSEAIAVYTWVRKDMYEHVGTMEEPEDEKAS